MTLWSHLKIMMTTRGDQDDRVLGNVCELAYSFKHKKWGYWIYTIDVADQITKKFCHLAVMTISSLTPLLPTPCRRSRVQPKVEALVFLAWVEPRGGSLPSPANGRCWILGPSKKLATGAPAKQTRGRNMLCQRKRKYGAKKEVERGAEMAKK